MAGSALRAQLNEGKKEERGASSGHSSFKSTVPTGAVRPKPAPVPQKTK